MRWYFILLWAAAYIAVGYPTFAKTVRNILGRECDDDDCACHGDDNERESLFNRIFDENLLMAVAAIGAFAIGEYVEGAAVLVLYRFGEYLQDKATGRSRGSIEALMDIRPDFANVRRNGATERVTPESVTVGEIIVVAPGERVPLDAEIFDGRTSLDTAALTGEPLPRDVGIGDTILAGMVNISGVITATVIRPYGESATARILEMTQNAAAHKAKTERFITRFARYYTPSVVGAAILLAVILIAAGGNIADSVRRALVFLVASCPCALVISVPLTFFAGIGGAAKLGILVKGANYLEQLAKADVVVFDKTGTLTTGKFTVINAPDPRVLELAAYAEFYSTHPIAVSIRNAYSGTLVETRITEYEEIAGRGVRAVVDGAAVIEVIRGSGAGVDVYENGVVIGRIELSDTIKSDAKDAVARLRDLGVRQIGMFTGDASAEADRVSAQIGLDFVRSGLLPHEKTEQLPESNGAVVFVGDGINDAPTLKRADVGVAMGGIGSDAALESADIVLMSDEPSRLPDAIKIARKTQTIVRQNIVFALAVKAVVLILGAAGIATMWAAVFSDVGVALLAVLNATRARALK
ncbi:MAG: cadmium-translocating P-type ATPase [Oscillospiraceae bacterium]|jgi:Cd2+/Zn2+-exporting ATPase|nr:cadmium-translocating P-type ATPase [Oscillospiraceae bacterium]